MSLRLDVRPIEDAPAECADLTIAPFTRRVGRETHHFTSGMLRRLQQREPGDRVVLGWEGNKLVGWALLQASSPFLAPGQWKHLSVFVLPKWRRRGYGTALVRAAREHAGSDVRVIATPIDMAGIKTFARGGIECR